MALQAAFFHNGAFTKLDDALKFHVDTINVAKAYAPGNYGVQPDLTLPPGAANPTDRVLKTLDGKLAKPLNLTPQEFADLLAFVANGLLDPRAKPDELMKQIPTSVPSGAGLPTFVKP